MESTVVSMGIPVTRSLSHAEGSRKGTGFSTVTHINVISVSTPLCVYTTVIMTTTLLTLIPNKTRFSLHSDLIFYFGHLI